MFKTFFLSLKIDYFSAINSFLYSFGKIKFLDRLLHSFYQKSGFKIFLSILSSILTLLSSVLSEAIYLFLIYSMSHYLSKEQTFPTFLHIYFVFTMIGMFIHTSLLNIGNKHYTSICLLSMDAKDYLLSHLFYHNFIHSFIQVVLLSRMIPNLHGNSFFILLLPILSFLSKIVGEMINLKYYSRSKIKITENYFLYFSIVISLCLVSFLPCFSLSIPSDFYTVITFFFFLLFLYSLFYLFSYRDYKTVVKEILHTRVLSTNHSFHTKDLVQIREKEKEISKDKLNHKKGYDRLNAIFFERHKNILLNSSIKISVFLIILGIIGIFYLKNNPEMIGKVSFFFHHYLGIFIFFMYFINRGGIITQAMFMNCDHAMLRYNFYRNPEVTISMYQKRVKTVTWINLIPAFVIGILLVLYGSFFTDFSSLSLLSLFLSSFVLSIFFSIFYLVTYYLFQPYNEEFRMVSFSYSLSHFMTYIVCFLLIKIPISIEGLLIGSSIFTALIILLSNYLIKNKSFYTFRIK